MKNELKVNGRAASVPAGMAMAAAASMILTAILCVLIAYFLNRGKMTWEQAGYWIMAMLFFVTFVGGKLAYSAVKRQRLLISLMSGIIYWGLLLSITALFWGGNYGPIWETAGIIGAGCLTSALLKGGRCRKKNKRAYC